MPGTLTRWDPFAEMAELRGRFDRQLDEFGATRGREWAPPIDVEREDGKLVVRADVPGIKPDEIHIEVRDGYLTLSGERGEAKEEQKKRYMRRERRYGSFSRTLPLPEGVEAKKIKAKTHDGVLEVTIPLQGGGEGDRHHQADRRVARCAGPPHLGGGRCSRLPRIGHFSVQRTR
jgi:HSP20 family protein